MFFQIAFFVLRFPIHFLSIVYWFFLFFCSISIVLNLLQTKMLTVTEKEGEEVCKLPVKSSREWTEWKNKEKVVEERGRWREGWGKECDGEIEMEKSCKKEK